MGTIDLREQSVALVTGGARGIGRGVALAFARAGANVVIADLHDADGDALVREIERLGREALFVHTDVADVAAVDSMLGAVDRRFGRLDYACNNAGIEGSQGATAECSIENFDRVIGVNLRGLFLCMRGQIQRMLAGGGGSIVNMASVAGLVGFAGLPAYCASKGGVVQLTRTAAVEYAQQNIRVNAICPGAIKTEMIDRITGPDPETVREFEALHPMGRMGTVEEVANSTVWLCSEGAAFITGQALAVDGGLVAR